MTKFEKAVKLIAEEYKEDCVQDDCTIKELFKAWQFDNEDAKAEFWSILNEKFDGEFKTFRQLMKAVKNYQF